MIAERQTPQGTDVLDPWFERTWRLSEMELFADLSAGEVDAIGSVAPMREVARGSLLYGRLAGAEVLFILKRGRVRLFRTSPDGRTLTTAIVTPGQMFGQMPMLGQRMGDTMAEMMDPGVVCLMSGSDVEKLLLADPRIARRIAEALAARVSDLEQRLSDTALKSLSERVAAAIITLAGAPPNPIRLAHGQLADLVGTTRESVTKMLGELRDRDLIRIRRGRIDVVDVAALRMAGTLGPQTTSGN
jgi:CRP/FNR family cyclic AMP-dependent transcriptional regulator